jgi:hypothetical protein
VTAACPHDFFIRYVLDDSAPSHAQRDGLDDRGRPYRDVPMLPWDAFAYAESIGSTFESRVLEASCRTCGVDVLDLFRKGLT